MLTLTGFERSVRAVLMRRVRRSGGATIRALIPYGELDADLADDRREGDPELKWPRQAFHEALGHVSMYEAEHGRPLLTAVVVAQETGLPADGFWRLARHLGFEFTDNRLFWRDEVSAILDTWIGDGTDVAFPIVEALDRGLELLDRRIRNLERAVRQGGALPYLDWTTTWGFKEGGQRQHIVVKNVGSGPAVRALYFGCRGETGGLHSEEFALAPGEEKIVKLLRGWTPMPNSMDRDSESIHELVVCKDGTGRWVRFQPRVEQRPDVWVERPGASLPMWATWHQGCLRELERGRA